jgi:uncharacterized membrane protein
MWWWIPGALLGGIAGYLFHADAWMLGAVAGAGVGWLGGRARSGPANERLAEIQRSVDELDARLAAVEQRLREVVAPPAPREPVVPAARETTPAASHVAHPPLPRPAPVAPPAAAPVPAVPPPVIEPPPPAVEPSRPTGVESPAWEFQDSAVWRWITGGNTIVRVGVVILFVGVAFLLKYAQEHVRVPIELRLTAVALGALVLLAIGWRLRERRPGYALSVQGGAVGVLYLVVFAAFRLYGLLPPVAAFALLVAVAALSAVIAVAQDALALAVLGASGGFLAPILASTGGGSHVALFGYYAVLNAGILGIAWFKAWRILNLVGFAFTFGIGTFWGVSFYRPEHLRTTEPFLVLFFLVYLAIPILFARRRAVGLAWYVDVVLVFGLPVVAFGLQVGLVAEIAFGAAWSALALAVVYLALASVIFGRAGGGLLLLAESFLALGVVFGTLAIPLAVDGRWTSAAWALEGAALLWAGVRQRRALAQAFGVTLQFAAGVAFLLDPAWPVGAVPVVNRAYLGCVMLAVAGLFCAWYVERHPGLAAGAPEPIVARLLFGWGVAWWVGGALQEIDHHVPSAHRVHAALMVLALSCAAFSVLHTRLVFRLARYPALAVPPLMVVAAALDAAEQPHPLAHLGAVAWPLALALHLVLLRRHQTESSPYQYWAHAAGLWLLAALGAWEVGWGIDRLVGGRAVWPIIAWALVPGALLTLLALAGARMGWPVSAHRDAYLRAGAAPLAAFLGLWAVLVNFVSNGDPAPLPYVPILNPLDLAQVGAVLAVGLWFVEGRRLRLTGFAEVPLATAYGLLAAGAFVWANAVLLRTIHHWAGVAFEPQALVSSDLVQTALSIFWTLLALTSMVVATRRGVRIAWLAGAGLMAVVVAKLFLVDLSNVGTVQRIVSFIGVGVLMLVVGYVSPVPPRTPERA